MQVAREITLSTSLMVICQDAYSHQHCTMTDVIKNLQMRKRKKTQVNLKSRFQKCLNIVLIEGSLGV